jgi:predicted unusual protein kinase regulating ubiquinone biosynthesis (AarF/ABC1/UbiB family)
MSKEVRPTEIVAEFEGIILNELNMLREAKNATQLREKFQDSELFQYSDPLDQQKNYQDAYLHGKNYA